MIASCTSSLNSASCTRLRVKVRSTRSSLASTLSGLRLGSGEVNVTPVVTSWYNSAAVANRYALATDAVSVQSGARFQPSVAFGEKRVASTSFCVTRVLPFTFRPSKARHCSYRPPTVRRSLGEMRH